MHFSEFKANISDFSLSLDSFDDVIVHKSWFKDHDFCLLFKNFIIHHYKIGSDIDNSLIDFVEIPRVFFKDDIFCFNILSSSSFSSYFFNYCTDFKFIKYVTYLLNRNSFSDPDFIFSNLVKQHPHFIIFVPLKFISPAVIDSLSSSHELDEVLFAVPDKFRFKLLSSLLSCSSSNFNPNFVAHLVPKKFHSKKYISLFLKHSDRDLSWVLCFDKSFFSNSNIDCIFDLCFHELKDSLSKHFF